MRSPDNLWLLISPGGFGSMRFPSISVSCASFASFAALFALLPAQAVAPDRGVPSTTGLVVSTSGIASDIGAAVLHAGGNAVDAAIATAFALAVTHPSAGNIGGGGFMVVVPREGEPTTFDYREKAPLLATPTMYLDSKGDIDGKLTAAGWLAAGVPGTVRGMDLVHRRFGSKPWRDLVLPAAELAERGFALPAGLARSLNAQIDGSMARFPASVAAYGKPGGGKWQAGDNLVLTDLGRTLRLIATEGADVFYKGAIAEQIVADMAKNGGIVSKADLSAYEAVERAPVVATFRGYEVLSMPPPSSGGVAIVQALNILECFELPVADRFSASTLHLIIEAKRRAYLDRARHLGDPDFVEVPVARLTSKEYAVELAAGIDRDKASSSAVLGADILTGTVRDERDETTHFSVIDKNGMAVANTYTLEGGFGSHVVVAGAGFLLNNEMGDFNRKPGLTDVRGTIGTKANVIAPGKRMLSSMTPTIVRKDGRVVLVTGSPGGRTIINTVLDVVLNVTAYGMNARQAVDAGRMHHAWMPDSVNFETATVAEAEVVKLRAMGHDVSQRGRQGDAHSILVDLATDTAWGANDRRSSESKAAK
ncbi:MAG: gamma-glutamyltransferase [Planctomycetota bacterium]